MSATKKILIESSAVQCVVDLTTDAHEGDFSSALPENHIKSGSAYIRMEVIRAWLGDATYLACQIDMYGSPGQALKMVSQSYNPRVVKRVMDLIGTKLEEAGSLPNSQQIAEEFARMGIGIVRKYDRRVRDRIPNKSSCVLGNRKVSLDFNRLIDSCREFITDFGGVQSCSVREVLTGDVRGCQGVKALKPLSGVIDSVDKASERLIDPRQITCKQCSAFGDVVIALEQPRAAILAHVDRAFNQLCECLGRQHIEIASRAASERGSR